MRGLAIWFSVAVTLLSAPAAGATTIFYISGGGYGHGIGMSQYGAYGYALHGKDYRFILAHYYQGTTLQRTNPAQTVRVLLDTTGTASFSGATAAGRQRLAPAGTYSVHPLADGMLAVYGPSGKQLGRFASPLTVTGKGPLSVPGHGRYRGALEFRAVGGAVQTVNAVGLDDYVRGVVSAEMPAGWSMDALKAQAVAARTYAITSNVGGNGFQLYPDTRSQVYGGVSAETPSTDAAVAATRGQIVASRGAPATTFFFSSSGGYTEDVQNVWLGSSPEPWLRGVPDPYDGVASNPYHRWAYRLTMAGAAAKLGALVKGHLIGVRVTKHGVSPRVVRAEVVGTGGSSSVTGPQLQSTFGLPSTYMMFTAISSTPTLPSSPGAPSTGGAPAASLRMVLRAALAEAEAAVARILKQPPGLHGTVFPAPKGALALLEVSTRKGWRIIRYVRLGAGGRYSIRLPDGGRYRIVYHVVPGPAISVR